MTSHLKIVTVQEKAVFVRCPSEKELFIKIQFRYRTQRGQVTAVGYEECHLMGCYAMWLS
jgi:hypothetical protein